MNYTIFLFDKKEIEVTEEELKEIITSDNLVHIRRLNLGINRKSISHYEPTAQRLAESRRYNKYGILHDGMEVVRQFGRWCNPKGAMDENGHYLSCEFDSRYYPEVVRDCVPGPEEFYKKYEQLESGERLKLILGDVGYEGDRVLREGGFKKIGETLKQYEKNNNPAEAVEGGAFAIAHPLKNK